MKDQFMKYKHYNKIRIPLLIFIDVLIISLSFLLAQMLQQQCGFKDLFVGEFKINWYELLNIVLLQIFVFIIGKVYLIFTRYMTVRDCIKVASLVVGTNILYWTILYFIDQLSLSFTLLAVITVFEGSLLLVPRLIERVIGALKTYQKNKNKNDRSLIYGAGEGGRLVLNELLSNDLISYYPVGFLDDDHNKKGRYIEGYKVFGSLKDLDEIVNRYKIDTIIVAISSLDKKEFKRIVDILSQYPIKVKKVQVINDGIEKGKVVDVDIKDLLNRGEVKLDQEELSSYISDKVIMVTGAGGSIGSELCRQIATFNPSHIVMLDVNENGLYMLEQEFNRNKMHNRISSDLMVTTIVASIRDKKAIDEVIEKFKPVAIFHAAAHKHVPLMETRPMEAIKNNVFGTYNCIVSAIEHKVERFIMISTDKAVNPTNVMGATKRMTEMILQAYGDNGVTKLAAVRFGNVLGSNGSVIPIFKKQIEEGGPVTITDKKIIRYFMTIPEAAQLVLQAGYYADKGDIFVLDMGEPVKILDLAEKMIRLSGYEPYKDIEIKEIGLRPGEKMFEELRLGNEVRHKTKNDLIFVNEKMDISLSVINDKLNYLHEAIDKHLDKEAYREIMLDIIK